MKRKKQTRDEAEEFREEFPENRRILICFDQDELLKLKPQDIKPEDSTIYQLLCLYPASRKRLSARFSQDRSLHAAGIRAAVSDQSA